MAEKKGRPVPAAPALRSFQLSAAARGLRYAAGHGDGEAHGGQNQQYLLGGSAAYLPAGACMADLRRHETRAAGGLDRGLTKTQDGIEHRLYPYSCRQTSSGA